MTVAKNWWDEKADVTNSDQFWSAIQSLLIIAAASVGFGAVGYRLAQEHAKAELASAPAAQQRPAEQKPAEQERPASDHRVESAKRVAEMLAEARGKVALDIGRIRGASSAFRHTQSEGFGDLKVAESLLAHAELAVVSAIALDEKLQSLERELHHGKAAMLAASQAYKDRSGDLSDQKLKEVSLGFSRHYEELATAIPQERQEIQALRYDLPGLLALVKETRTLMSDYVLFLRTHTDGKLPAQDVEFYHATLKDYVQRHSRFEESLGKFRKK